jgi:hypothetical protein
VGCLKPSLYLVKRDMGRSLDSRKTEVLFVVVDSDIPKDYPANFVCVLPLTQGLCGHSIFSKLFGEDSLSLARRLLSRALVRESDSEIRTAIGKRLKLLDPKAIVKARCHVCKNLFEPKSFRGHYQKTCQGCKSRMIVSAK